MLERGHLLPSALGLIILITFFGNVLVCLSVIKVRKLRHPSNYLLISLAISDLCVACFVMPFGLYSAISDKWQLGTLLCNVYVVSDVTSCTASILNLCVISIDRYFAITRPLTYCIKRTTRLMLLLIGLVWALACLISVPPLLISGNEYGTPDSPKCEVSQSVWYQLYATIFSFYIPLAVMIFIYYNIYTAAKKVVEAEQRATTGLQVSQRLQQQQAILASTKPATNVASANHATTNTTSSANLKRINSATTKNAGHRKGARQQRSKSASLAGFVGLAFGRTNSSAATILQPAPPSGCDQIEREADSSLSKKLEQNSTTTSTATATATATTATAPPKTATKTTATKTTITNQQQQQQQKSSVMRERKASITLGVIMSAFTICWLPFFIIALMRPFSDTVNNLPAAVTQLTLWLGYANSLLNPIIYVTFHHDFRNAFKHLLCFRCMTINEHIRKDEYKAQCGAP